MLVLFAGVLWFGVLKGLEIDCGCFSPAEVAEHDGLRQALYRDLGLLAVAAYLYLWRLWPRLAGLASGWRGPQRMPALEASTSQTRAARGGQK
jgi:hypothetical protein